jgi:putative membrane protein
MDALLSFIIVLVAAAIVLMIVSRLKMGIEVTGLGGAMVAALVIAIVSAVVLWLLALINIEVDAAAGLWGALVALVVAAVVLMISDRFTKGMKVAGFRGAIIGAIGIAIVTWALNWLISLF